VKLSRADLILVAGSLAMALVLVEILLRFVLFSGMTPALAAPTAQFLSTPGTDDSYRLELAARLAGRPAADPELATFDSTLGHVARPRSASNPLGLAEEHPYALDDLRGDEVMLFFGDSFTEGFTDYPDKIPQLLDSTFSRLRVLNLGVMGYGLDQMFLRMTQVVGLFDRPHLVFGVLFDDIDRVAYALRETPKPYFQVRSDSLRLSNVPISPRVSDWGDAYPPQERSYALALLRGGVDRALKTHWAHDYAFGWTPGERTAGRARKQAVTTALVRRIRAEAVERGAKLTFVIFPHTEHVTHRGWREEFFTALLESEGADYIFLKPALLQRLQDEQLRWWSDVYGLRSHPTAEENRFLAGHIARCLHERYGYEIAALPPVELPPVCTSQRGPSMRGRHRLRSLQQRSHFANPGSRHALLRRLPEAPRAARSPASSVGGAGARRNALHRDPSGVRAVVQADPA
jgi:hypothetical protein